ncbi:MAG: DMT family transporter, partial [Negativicutes bacterium]|nr:DMT family transporter [Negativicutes bacterium]
FYWWNKGVAVVGPNCAAIFINMMPVSGMIFAALFLRETISIIQIVGALLIIAGVWLTTQVKIIESVSG